MKQGFVNSIEKISSRYKVVDHAHTWILSLPCCHVENHSFVLLSFILSRRFAYTGIMVYVIWDAYANPYHKHRLGVNKSKVYPELQGC